MLINIHYCNKYCHEYDVGKKVHAHMIKDPKYSLYMSSTWLNIFQTYPHDQLVDLACNFLLQCKKLC